VENFVLNGRRVILKILDLFAGCGGLSEGFSYDPFEIVAHVEMDKDACKSLMTRSCYRKLLDSNNLNIYNDYLEKKISVEELHSLLSCEDKSRIINKEINNDTIENIFEIIDKLKGTEEIDGIVGGPPCQAYSTIGRAVNKQKLSFDERIYLYEYYIKFLEKYRPSFFLFENVKGLLSFKDQFSEKLFPKIIKQFEASGYEIATKLVDMSEYGVSQKRERLIIFGLKKDLIKDKINEVPYFELLLNYREKPISIKKLFSDLPRLKDGEENNSYTTTTIHSKVSEFYRGKNLSLSLNIARKHNARDKEIYILTLNKKMKGEQLKYYDIPEKLRTHKNVNSFVDRYKAIDGEKISHTIVAHISKDGHYYIHPDNEQNRSITVREAARIQGFPDDYYFESSRTAAYRQIGNAVPPYFSYKLAAALIKKLRRE
jgi:DNA (cytosine-5)-methyltransferase 1